MTNSELVKEAFAALDAGNFDKFTNYLAKEYKIHGLTETPMDRDQFLAFARATYAAFPDISRNVVVLWEGKDGEVRGEMHVTGTHRGTLNLPFLPEVAATNKSVHLPKNRWTCQVKNGKAVSFTIESGAVSPLIAMLTAIGRDDLADCLRTKGRDCRTIEEESMPLGTP
jgi:ketosteroid isomerase-like protein